MAGLAGIARPGMQEQVKFMLEKIQHRGRVSSEILLLPTITLGFVWDQTGDHSLAQLAEENQILKRDPLGIVPIYYGWSNEGELYFASEVKALLPFVRQVKELPPGCTFDGRTIQLYFSLKRQQPLDKPPQVMANELRSRLDLAVKKRLCDGRVGTWLSGGLDSSLISALVRPHIERLYTFAAGLPDAPDLNYARLVANFIQSDHHEVCVQLSDLIEVLPSVIYHLESFDAWLVRSSLLNFLAGRQAADFVPIVFSGEGGDELFAGYEYLKMLDPALLEDELIDITSRLHNTALQRVDRCSMAHGLVAYVPFLDQSVVSYALRIPVRYKLLGSTEKWILRQAMIGLLPDVVLHRPKAKFWQGAGVGDLLALYAEERVSDTDFAQERRLTNGWLLNSKEELLYYRIFKEHFGELSDLQWMGRTKGMPVT